MILVSAAITQNTSIHNPWTWECQRFLFNLTLHFKYKASNKCYFHAKLFLFSVTSLICVRGLLSSVMPRAIFHLTEEAKSQDAIVHNGPQQPILFKNWLLLSNEVMYEPVWCDKPHLWAGAPFIFHDWGSEVPIIQLHTMKCCSDSFLFWHTSLIESQEHGRNIKVCYSLYYIWHNYLIETDKKKK